MIIAIDIGNTTVGIGGVEYRDNAYTLQFSGKLETNRSWTDKDYMPLFRELLQTHAVSRACVSGVVLSSVVPTVQQAMEQCAKQVLDMEPLVITCESDLGITLDVDFPEKLGRDRLVDSAWAAANYPLPVVTADLGTASTFNVIREGGILCGGVIAAGLLTGLRALANGTAQLPAIDLKIPEHVIGRNTADCMLSGAVVGTASILDGIALSIEEELGQPITLVITGGGAKYVDSLVRHPHVYDPDLILKGLAYLYTRNQK